MSDASHATRPGSSVRRRLQPVPRIRPLGRGLRPPGGISICCAAMSHAARRVLESVSVAPESLPDSVVSSFRAVAITVKSDAVLAVAARLVPWSLTRCGRVSAKEAWNHIYDWSPPDDIDGSGGISSVRSPPPNCSSRFLDAAEFSGIGPQDPHPGVGEKFNRS